MKFDEVTAELFDKTIAQADRDQSVLEARLEAVSCSELVENSFQCGIMAKETLQLLSSAANVGAQRRILVGLFGVGLRMGWHLRRTLHEREEIQGMMSDAEFDALRREIREKA